MFTELAAACFSGRDAIGGLPYPFHDRTVTHGGHLCFGQRNSNLSIVLAGQNLSLKEVSEKIWLVSFLLCELGFFDHQSRTLSSAENPS